MKAVVNIYEIQINSHPTYGNTDLLLCKLCTSPIPSKSKCNTPCAIQTIFHDLRNSCNFRMYKTLNLLYTRFISCLLPRWFDFEMGLFVVVVVATFYIQRFGVLAYIFTGCIFIPAIVVHNMLFVARVRDRQYIYRMEWMRPPLAMRILQCCSANR